MDEASVIDWASWLSAVGTVGAFGVSLWLMSVQMNDRRKDKEEAKKENAKRVSAWYDDVHPNPDKANIWVQNLGDEPIYFAVVRAGRAGVDFSLPPGINDHLPEGENNQYTEFVFGHVAPGQKLNWNIKKLAGGHFPDIPEIELEFTDAAGRHWLRRSEGGLQEIACRRPFD